MSTAKDKVFTDALALDARERADLAARLLESLESGATADMDRTERAWALEVTQRCMDLDQGRGTVSPWSDVRRQLEREILRR